MPKYIYLVTVDTALPEYADEVIQQRLGHDEDYGYDYTLEYNEVARGIEPSAVVTIIDALNKYADTVAHKYQSDRNNNS